MRITISKSQFLEALRCPRLIWMRNRPEISASPDPMTLHLFAVGRRVGLLAHQRYPSGVLISNGAFRPFDQLLSATRTEIANGAPFLFEGAFEHDAMRCKTDVLERLKASKWNLKEVKMAGSVKKEQHIPDVSFQKYCLERLGYQVSGSFIVHINKDYTRTGEIEPEKLFAEADLTADIAAEMPLIPLRIKRIIETIKKNSPPEVVIGAQCKNPGICPYFFRCHAGIEPGSVYELPYGHRIIPILLSQGITRLCDVPAGTRLTPRQSAVVASARKGKPIINRPEIAIFLSRLRRPFFFLDFEGINSCLPPFVNSSPYERIPFQYSLDIQRRKNGSLIHREFLAENANDPRETLIQSLLSDLGERGSIVSWNMSYEVGVLKAIQRRFSAYAERIERLFPRFVDLIIPFRTSYIDYRFQGSASLKAVLPVITSLSYNSLAIQKGDETSLLYERFLENDLSENDWNRSRRDLLDYCGMDTRGMVEITESLFNVAKGGRV